MLPPIPANPELETSLFQDIENLDLWSIYADYLQGLDHLLGEMVALELTYRRNKSTSKMRSAMRQCMEKAYAQGMVGRNFNCDGFLRPLNPELRKETNSSLGLSWEMGFIKLIRLYIVRDNYYKNNLADLKGFLGSPFAHLLAQLDIKFLYSNNQTRNNTPASFFEDLLGSFQGTAGGRYLSRIRLEGSLSLPRRRLSELPTFLAHFENLRSLELDGECHIPELQNQNLHNLSFKTFMQDEGMQNLLMSRDLPQLERLNLNLHRAGQLPQESTLGFLLANVRLQNLKRIDLNLIGPNPQSMETLTRLDFPNLHTLNLRIQPQNDQGELWETFHTFFQNVRLPALEELGISFEDQEASCLRALVETRFLSKLKRLRLIGQKRRRSELRLLLDHKQDFLQLESLVLEDARLDDKIKGQLMRVFGSKVFAQGS